MNWTDYSKALSLYIPTGIGYHTTDLADFQTAYAGMQALGFICIYVYPTEIDIGFELEAHSDWLKKWLETPVIFLDSVGLEMNERADRLFGYIARKRMSNNHLTFLRSTETFTTLRHDWQSIAIIEPKTLHINP